MAYVPLHRRSRGPSIASMSSKLNRVEEAIEDIRQGKVVIVVDDEDRENEGDFVTAARNATPEVINFMGSWKSVGQIEWENMVWDSWYNSERVHSAIGYVPPQEAEEAFYESLNQDQKAA